MDQAIEQLLPHRPPMLLLERIVRVGDDGAEAVCTFDPDGPWVRCGAVHEAVLLECLAQTAATIHGQEAARARRPIAAGMLVAVRRFAFRHPARAEKPIRFRVRITRRLSPFTLVEGQVYQADALIAQGELRFFLDDTASHP